MAADARARNRQAWAQALEQSHPKVAVLLRLSRWEMCDRIAFLLPRNHDLSALIATLTLFRLASGTRVRYEGRDWYAHSMSAWAAERNVGESRARAAVDRLLATGLFDSLVMPYGPSRSLTVHLTPNWDALAAALAASERAEEQLSMWNDPADCDEPAGLAGATPHFPLPTMRRHDMRGARPAGPAHHPTPAATPSAAGTTPLPAEDKSSDVVTHAVTNTPTTRRRARRPKPPAPPTKGRTVDDPRRAREHERFDEFVAAYPTTRGWTIEVERAWVQHVRDGADPTAIIAAAKVMRSLVEADGYPPQYVPGPARFLGGRNWENFATRDSLGAVERRAMAARDRAKAEAAAEAATEEERARRREAQYDVHSFENWLARREMYSKPFVWDDPDYAAAGQ